MTPLFLYGLFMDVRTLEAQGLCPRVSGRARLANHRIQIADRATLLPARGSTAYGLLVCLTEPEIEVLYASPSVAGYQRSVIEVTRMDNGTPETATLFNLPSTSLEGHSANRDYARDLAGLVRRLGFPSSYAQEIEDCA